MVGITWVSNPDARRPPKSVAKSAKNKLVMVDQEVYFCHFLYCVWKMKIVKRCLIHLIHNEFCVIPSFGTTATTCSCSYCLKNNKACEKSFQPVMYIFTLECSLHFTTTIYMSIIIRNLTYKSSIEI